MKLSVNRKYKLKFYLNAEHYVILNNQRGDLHPHTWEIQLYFGLPRNVFLEFSDIEKSIEEYFKQYQNKILNEIEPFDSIIPTLENMTDFFAKECYQRIKALGGTLYSVENAETPTRTYCVSLHEEETFNLETIDAIVDKIVSNHE